MSNQAPCRSRRIWGLSLESTDPSTRRCRSNIAGDYHPVFSDVAKRDPPLGLEGFVAGSGVAINSKRSTPLTSRVLFLGEEEEEVEVEEVPQPPESLPSPLPPSSPFIIEYIGPESARPESPHPSYFHLLMATTGNAALAVNAASIQTPA